MNNVKVERLFTINGLASRSLRDHRESTERNRKLASIHPLAIEAGLKDMLVVAETTAAKGSMKLLRSPVSLSVGAIRTITWTNRWKNRTGTMNQQNDLILRER
jgi:hypothetical protein